MDALYTDSFSALALVQDKFHRCCVSDTFLIVGYKAIIYIVGGNITHNDIISRNPPLLEGDPYPPLLEGDPYPPLLEGKPITRHSRSAVVGIEIIGSSRYVPRKDLGVPDDQFSSVGPNVQGVPINEQGIARLYDRSNTSQVKVETHAGPNVTFETGRGYLPLVWTRARGCRVRY